MKTVVLIFSASLLTLSVAKAAPSPSLNDVSRAAMANPSVRALIAVQAKRAHCGKFQMGPSPLNQDMVISPETAVVHISCSTRSSDGDSQTDITIAGNYQSGSPNYFVVSAIAFSYAD